jgi:hypothetical protein
MDSFIRRPFAIIGQISARILGQPRLGFPFFSRVAINLEPRSALFSRPNLIRHRNSSSIFLPLILERLSLHSLARVLAAL